MADEKLGNNPNILYGGASWKISEDVKERIGAIQNQLLNLKNNQIQRQLSAFDGVYVDKVALLELQIKTLVQGDILGYLLEKDKASEPPAL